MVEQIAERKAGNIVGIAGMVVAAAQIAQHPEREMCFVGSACVPVVVVAVVAAAAAVAVLAAEIAEHRANTGQHTG